MRGWAPHAPRAVRAHDRMCTRRLSRGVYKLLTCFVCLREFVERRDDRCLMWCRRVVPVRRGAVVRRESRSPIGSPMRSVPTPDARWPIWPMGAIDPGDREKTTKRKETHATAPEHMDTCRLSARLGTCCDLSLAIFYHAFVIKTLYQKKAAPPWSTLAPHASTDTTYMLARAVPRSREL